MMTAPQLSPERIFGLFNAYQQTAALKAGIELDVFTAIKAGHTTSQDLATHLRVPERGVRILCDYLTITGLLSKTGGQYVVAPDAGCFLDRASPAYIGGAHAFIANDYLIGAFHNLAATIRDGHIQLAGEGTVSEDNPIWVTFAQTMAPLMVPAAQAIAELLGKAGRVLDIAAGHGMFGIAIAQHDPDAAVTALDWPDVLEVARGNAARAGVANRHKLLSGDAFKAEFGGPYDTVLVTNFFHHFDQPANVGLMRKIYDCLAPGGRCVTLEFVPNDDRVTPPTAAAFAMQMLGGTPAGDAYTFREYQSMFAQAGFTHHTLHSLPTPEQVIVSTK